MPSHLAEDNPIHCSTGVLHRDQFTASVIANISLCREHYRLVLKVDRFPATLAGQFIQISCREMREQYDPDHEIDWHPGMRPQMLGMELSGPLAFLRRPFSLAGRRNLSDRVELDIIHRIVGIGTDWMSHLKVGDHVDILGPLGNQFTVPAAGQKAILVGGGVGIPPMLYLAEALAGMDAAVFCGALSRDLLPMTLLHNSSGHTPSSSVAEFTKYGVASTITTNDGSFGFHGLVTVALEKHLDDLGFTKCDTGAVKPNSPILYCCGPEPMMKRVADIAKERRLESQIAIERAMACGMGTCQSCCIKLIRDPARDGQAFAGKDWIYKLACTDGPVFKGADLLW